MSPLRSRTRSNDCLSKALSIDCLDATWQSIQDAGDLQDAVDGWAARDDREVDPVLTGIRVPFQEQVHPGRVMKVSPRRSITSCRHVRFMRLPIWSLVLSIGLTTLLNLVICAF